MLKDKFLIPPPLPKPHIDSHLDFRLNNLFQVFWKMDFIHLGDFLKISFEQDSIVFQQFFADGLASYSRMKRFILQTYKVVEVLCSRQLIAFGGVYFFEGRD